jgi:hypothetical protein
MDAGGIVETRRGPKNSEGSVIEAGESRFYLAPDAPGSVGPKSPGAVGGGGGKFPICDAPGQPGSEGSNPFFRRPYPRADQHPRRSGEKAEDEQGSLVGIDSPCGLKHPRFPLAPDAPKGQKERRVDFRTRRLGRSSPKGIGGAPVKALHREGGEDGP